MPIKHLKTDTIADWTQAQLNAQIALGNYPVGTTLADIVLPSDWNANHTNPDIADVTGLTAALAALATSVSNADGTLSISPTTGAIIASRAAITGDIAINAGSNSATLATVNSNTGSFSYSNITVNAKGLITAASSGAAPEVPLTFSTGLTRSTNTITANLSTGISGGQSVIGGTGAGENLTISSTSSLTKGQIRLGTSFYAENMNTLSLGGQENWISGLGAITHLLGPTDQAFSIASSPPAQVSSSAAGNALNLTAANAIAGSSVAGAANGGDINITPGNAARLTSGSANGGSVSIVGGLAVGSGTTGGVSITTALPTGTTGIIGSVLIKTADGVAGVTNASGSITLQTGATISNAGTISLIGGTPPATATAGAIGGPLVLIAGNGSSKTTQIGGNGGPITQTSGSGGLSTLASGNGTGGNGGLYSVVGGNGGNATGVGATQNTAGNGASLSFVAGNGGAASGATTNLAGPGGTITIQGGNGNATGTGSSTAGIGGDINITAGNSASTTSSPRGGNVNITAGNAANSGGANNGGIVTISGGRPTTNGGGVVIQTITGSSAVSTASISILTASSTGPGSVGGISFTTGSVGTIGGNIGGEFASPISFVTGMGATGVSAASGSGGQGGDVTFALSAGGTASGATSATGGRGGNNTWTLNAGGTATGSGTNLGGNGGTFSWVSGNGGNTSGGTSNIGGAAGGYSFTIGSPGVGSTANGARGTFSVAGGKTVLAATTTNYASLNIASGTAPTTPSDGDVWNDATNFKARIGGATGSIFIGADAAAAPSTNLYALPLNVYGSSTSNILAQPNSWASVIINGTTYKIPLYT